MKSVSFENYLCLRKQGNVLLVKRLSISTQWKSNGIEHWWVDCDEEETLSFNRRFRLSQKAETTFTTVL